MTREDANTIASAPAAPFANRRTRNGPRPVVSAMAPVVRPLTARAPSSQPAGLPGKDRRAAASAPSRYPRKLAEAISPASGLPSASPAVM